VDRWTVFEPDFERALQQEPVQAVPEAREFRPGMAEAPQLDISVAEGLLELSVEQATILALRYNRDLQVQQLNPVIAGTFERIERGVFDPELFSELGYSEEVASETSRATGEQFAVESSDLDAVAGIRQDLPSGAIFEATVEHEREQSNRAPDQRNARVGLTVTQSLLRGLGPTVNLVGVRQAELETLASLHELQGFTEALVAETETAYWRYVLALQELSIFESSLAIARQQRDEIEQQIDVGLLPETEAAAARAEVALREQALIDARSLLQERKLRLLRLINRPGGKPLDLEIRATSRPMIEPEPIRDQAERLALAEQARPDLREAILRMKQDRLEVLVTQNGLLPRLDLFIDLGRTGFAESTSASFQELDGSTYDIAAGLRLSRSLFNRSAQALDEQARAASRQAREAVDNLRQVVRLEVRLAMNEVERTRQQIAASKVTRRLEEQTFRAEKERFDVGSSTALLVAQAQRDLLVSRIAEVRSVIDYRLALVELYRAEGSLLQRRGIVIGNG
jgi:outer membrane protein TolC